MRIISSKIIDKPSVLQCEEIFKAYWTAKNHPLGTLIGPPTTVLTKATIPDSSDDVPDEDS